MSMACKVVIRGQDECVPLSSIELGGYFEREHIVWQRLSGEPAFCRVDCVILGSGAKGMLDQDIPVRRLRLVHAEFEREVTP